jgi:DNA helicase-2/ATP-dependent DNA helicase PcrA
MESILHGLNEQQTCAVTSPALVLQVLAPPGSGKTKTLTTRVAYHIAHEGLKPWNMIVCTFTRKAATEMQERIRAFVGDKLESKLVLGTFHSVARRYLNKYGHFLGIPKNFGVADTADSLAIIKRIIKRHEFGTEPSKARTRISKRKSGAQTSKPATAKLDTEQQEFEMIFSKYEDQLRESNLLDYDDLLLRCVELLERFPECVSNIEAVLIDEFQDTNCVQYDLMSLFAQHRKPGTSRRIPNITIVGDPDQSIYGFRSAEIKNITRMRTQYPDTQVVLLEENYRSSGSILHCALEVIEQDDSRPPKNLLATHSTGERPVLRTLPSAATEAAWLVAEIQRATVLTANLLTYSDFAVLLRSASLSRHIESGLGKAGIPYRMVGGHKFFDRVEVKILLDYLRVISQPDHNDALARVINVPPRKIGDPTIKALLEEAEKSKKTLWRLVLDISQGRRRATTKISAQAQKGLDMFTGIILTSQNKLMNHEDPCTIIDLIAHVMKKLSYRDFLQEKYSEEFENRWANVEELVLQASDNARKDELDEDTLCVIDGVDQREGSGAEETLARFLANVALSAAVDAQKDGEDPNQVTISTIHAAKGLEWPVVFIPAAYEGSIPHSRAEDADEERRLLYVGMTRAQSLLYLSWPKKNSANEAATLSPFLSSLSSSSCFDTKGPSFRFTVSQELARILGRSYPSESAINDARSAAERIDDDYWPEDGEDVQTETARWNKNQLISDAWTSNYNSDPITTEWAYKRQKISHITTSTTNVTSNVSRSSTCVSTGFVSAGARLKEIEAKVTTEEEPELKQKLDRKAGKAVHVIDRKKQTSNQGSIHSFFGKVTSSKQPVPTVPKGSDHFRKQVEVSSAQRPEFVPLQEITNRRPERFHSQAPALPSSFATHKLKSAPSSRPRHVFGDDEQSAQRYILLSSSPSKPDHNECLEDNTVDRHSAGLAAKGTAPEARTNSPVINGGFTPATTYHTTTMERLQIQQQVSQRRTLGMRRSLQGWNSKVNQPFSAPKRPRD